MSIYHILYALIDSACHSLFIQHYIAPSSFKFEQGGNLSTYCFEKRMDFEPAPVELSLSFQIIMM